MKRVSMKLLVQPLSLLASSGAVCVALLGGTLPSAAQVQASQLRPRITAPIDNSSRVTLAGSHPPRAVAADDIGAVPSSLQLQGISLVFSRSAAQQTALDTLVAAQQNPSSPLYHQWITPDQYAAQFGVSDSDIASVKTWLEQQGFAVQSVSRSHNRIVFSGTAGQVANAFGVPLHYYLTPATAVQPAATHFAPSADISLPAALASSVLAVNNLSDFRLVPHIVHAGLQPAQPRFTSYQTGNHYLTPGDLATIYDITPAYNSGYTGSNQSIAVVGQSEVELSDIANFQSAVGIAGKTPIVVLVPGSGTAEIYADGDEAESDLDLEYSSTIAKGAQVYFVYTGNGNEGAFNALEYAVDQLTAPIISSSYGECEPELGQSAYTSYNAVLEQAAAQGQTVVAAAGDDGSTDCYEYGSKDTADNEILAVDFPGSSQYVTSMGGAEFPTADVASGNITYFDAQSSADIVSSAKSYIPEMVWNDDVAAAAGCPGTGCEPLASGGGGVSIYTAQPPWQAGTIGGVAIPTTGGKRMVPDIALTASPFNAPLAFCTSDTTFWSTGQKASCNDGLRDASTGSLTVGGGTSFDAPTFSGLVAILNQAKGYSSTDGQGVINPTLYTLAADPTTYASAFHDITSGGNECLAGADYCSSPGTTEYYATIGYDEASGLGSIDFYNLLTAWHGNTATGATGSGTGSFTLAATNVTLAPGAQTTGTLNVTPAGGFTGTVILAPGYAFLTNGCVVFNPASVSITGTTAVPSTYTVYTSESACTTAGATAALRSGTQTASLHSSAVPHHPTSPWKQLPLPATLASTFLLVCVRRRSRLLRASLALGLLLTLSFTGLGLTGCSGSSSSNTGTTTTTSTPSTPTTDTPAGTYTITVMGSSMTTPSITTTTTFTVTVN
jgi:subtilase family serine protease